MASTGRITEIVDKIISQADAYQAFLNASPWGILVVEKTFHIIFMNCRLEEMTGHKFEDIAGQHMKVLIPHSDRDVHTAHEKDYIKDPHARTGNHGLRPRLLHKDGSTMDVEISLSPAKVDGKTVFFASIRNIETLFDTVEGKVKGT